VSCEELKMSRDKHDKSLNPLMAVRHAAEAVRATLTTTTQNSSLFLGIEMLDEINARNFLAKMLIGVGR
jgi:hypothetical protein